MKHHWLATVFQVLHTFGKSVRDFNIACGFRRHVFCFLLRLSDDDYLINQNYLKTVYQHIIISTPILCVCTILCNYLKLPIPKFIW